MAAETRYTLNTVRALRFLRKLRGGSQPDLIEADDGHFYVVKLQQNAQHRRILPNEWIGSAFLRYLGVCTPETVAVWLSEEFLAQYPGVRIEIGKHQVRAQPGLHFGSRCPGNPDEVASYDFIPDALLRRVVNRSHFLATLVLDQWMANADGRQAVFLHPRWCWSLRMAQPPPGAFAAQMIDQGHLLGGPSWDLPDSPIQGLYHRPLVYEQVRSLDEFQPWLDRVVQFPAAILLRVYRQLPTEWLAGDGPALERLLERLYNRRRRVPDLIAACRAGKPHVFPNWV